MDFRQWYTTSNGGFALALATIGADLRGSESAGGSDPVARVVTPTCPRGRLVWFFAHEPILGLFERVWNGERVQIPPEARDQYKTLLEIKEEMSTNEWRIGGVKNPKLRDLAENRAVLAGLVRRAHEYCGRSTGGAALALPKSWTVEESEDGWNHREEVEELRDEYDAITR